MCRHLIALVIAGSFSGCIADGRSQTPSAKDPVAVPAANEPVEGFQRMPPRSIRVGFMVPRYGQTGVAADTEVRVFVSGAPDSEQLRKDVDAAIVYRDLKSGVAVPRSVAFAPYASSSGVATGDIVATLRPLAALSEGGEYEASVTSSLTVVPSFEPTIRFRVGSAPRLAEVRFVPKGAKGEIAYVTVVFSEPLSAPSATVQLTGTDNQKLASAPLGDPATETLIQLPVPLAMSAEVSLRFIGTIASRASGAAFLAVRSVSSMSQDASTISVVPSALPMNQGAFVWRHP